jgi:hypothetical protein
VELVSVGGVAPRPGADAQLGDLDAGPAQHHLTLLLLRRRERSGTTQPAPPATCKAIMAANLAPRPPALHCSRAALRVLCLCLATERWIPQFLLARRGGVASGVEARVLFGLRERRVRGGVRGHLPARVG